MTDFEVLINSQEYSDMISYCTAKYFTSRGWPPDHKVSLQPNEWEAILKAIVAEHKVRWPQ